LAKKTRRKINYLRLSINLTSNNLNNNLSSLPLSLSLSLHLSLSKLEQQRHRRGRGFRQLKPEEKQRKENISLSSLCFTAGETQSTQKRLGLSLLQRLKWSLWKRFSSPVYGTLG
jgi:hypothetical protein